MKILVLRTVKTCSAVVRLFRIQLPLHLALQALRGRSTRRESVLTNVQVNAPQQAFPIGLLGRSETSIAATSDGQNLLVGFNDAQGFCGPPFGVACTPESPAGLSGGYLEALSEETGSNR